MEPVSVGIVRTQGGRDMVSSEEIKGLWSHLTVRPQTTEGNQKISKRVI